MAELQTGGASRSVPDPGSRENNDYDGLFKALLEAHPAETLHLLCGAEVPGDVEPLDGPTEQPRQRSRQKDKVFLVPARNGNDAEVYLIEIQVKKTPDFEERLVSYWASAALKYPKATHRIRQVVIWPLGNGYEGSFERDELTLQYRSVDLTTDLEPESILGSPLAPLALFAQKVPAGAAERVADQIAAAPNREEKLVLTDLGMLAGGSVAAQLTEILWRRGMQNVLEGTRAGDEIAQRNHERGLVTAMTSVLRRHHGNADGIEELAQALVAAGFDNSLDRIMAGASLEELRQVDPSGES
jgi:hypothetical protein